jgi:hypothetical protein
MAVHLGSVAHPRLDRCGARLRVRGFRLLLLANKTPASVNFASPVKVMWVS